MDFLNNLSNLNIWNRPWKELSLYLYFLLVFLVIIQRLLELKLSRQHESYLKMRGAIEVAPEHFVYMKWVHIGWLASCLAEAATKGFSPPAWPWSALFLAVFLGGQVLRWVSILTLKKRWTVRILVLPHQPPITHGIYRHIRHPNYWGVVLEILALPLIYGLWWTAIFFSLANALVLFVRIREEEAALNRHGLYEKAFAQWPG